MPPLKIDVTILSKEIDGRANVAHAIKTFDEEYHRRHGHATLVESKEQKEVIKALKDTFKEIKVGGV